jgi:AAA domain/UvrD-like helicase C-terminal domain
MSDASVHEALRSEARLVVVEAPAGCGKTYQGAKYTQEIGTQIKRGRVLILTHTHAAREVFHSRTSGCRSRVEIRTIDSLLTEIASAYHKALGLPADVGLWAIQENAFTEVGEKVCQLLQANRHIVLALTARYPLIICDEHQDASHHQEAIILMCLAAGSSVRIFGDPRQRIFSKGDAAVSDSQRWEKLRQLADRFEVLDTPHRWSGSHRNLGQWIQDRRRGLWEEGTLDLRPPLPASVRVIFAENQSLRFGGYRTSRDEAKPIWAAVRRSRSLLVLSAYNPTVGALRGLFSKELPIWEGHVRDNLRELVTAISREEGSPEGIATAAIAFTQKVVKGFSDSAFADSVLREVRSGCCSKRTGKPAQLQELARCLHAQPNHIGVALFLKCLHGLAKSQGAFAEVRFDNLREFWDAACLDSFQSPMDGLSELARRRTSTKHNMPKKAVSTVHKAKGLECDDVIIIPCDNTHFKDSEEARCTLYVAMSRGKRSLTFVVSQEKPSPLLRL